MLALSILGCNDDDQVVFSNPTGPSFRANYLIVGNRASNNISVYSVDTARGALTQVAGSPFAAGVSIVRMEVHPTGASFTPEITRATRSWALLSIPPPVRLPRCPVSR